MFIETLIPIFEYKIKNKNNNHEKRNQRETIYRIRRYWIHSNQHCNYYLSQTYNTILTMTTSENFTKFNINHDLLTAVKKAKELIDYNAKVENIQDKLNKQLIKTTKPCQ